MPHTFSSIKQPITNEEHLPLSSTALADDAILDPLEDPVQVHFFVVLNKSR